MAGMEDASRHAGAAVEGVGTRVSSSSNTGVGMSTGTGTGVGMGGIKSEVDAAGASSPLLLPPVDVRDMRVR